ncbi:MAG TPA: alpha-amylase family glycosyl hydrolase [Ktedonobacteraceae bacterium]|nr:alpha-amylase family glycosyl hydrolase [Ktedonobacteraceae bacterium]
MIDMNKVGAFVSALTGAGVPVRFGIYLPGIEQHDGYEVLVRVIHKEDRFNPDIKTKDFPLSRVAGDPNTLWQAEVTIPHQSGTKFGELGTYLYRYQLWQTAHGSRNLITKWFTDPIARATDVGQLAAFTTPGSVPEFVWTDNGWRVPELEHLVVYELHVEEFNSTFDGVIERLDYLKSLGVNCLELMPVTSLKLDFDWGYGPLHYFAPNERWGGVQGLKRLVNACHEAKIAVVLDVVYQHVDSTFPYQLVYQNAGIGSPMIGRQGSFGPQIDFDKEFARDYVQAANFHWLDEYHVDGFRYDEAPDFYDGPVGVKYAKLAFDTYKKSLNIPRFTPSGRGDPGEYSRIIQCPEALSDPQGFLRNTYSNATWQNRFLDLAEQMVRGTSADGSFVPQLLLDGSLGYPSSRDVIDRHGATVSMPVAPFQYLESHDHSQLICYTKGDPGNAPFGDRSKFYKLQPFAIALYTCVGIPMLWQGQEFAENYNLPEKGDERIRFRRDVNWEYFYDDYGAPLVRLYRRLGELRRDYPALRSRESFYYSEESRTGEGIVAYYRRSANQIAIVFLNFSDQTRSISVPVPEAGTYREMIDADEPNPLVRSVNHANLHLDVDVPSHYGYIFIKQ